MANSNLLETIRSKYQLIPAEIARKLHVKDSTVVRALNGDRGVGSSLLRRTFKVWPDEVIAWLKED